MTYDASYAQYNLRHHDRMAAEQEQPEGMLIDKTDFSRIHNIYANIFMLAFERKIDIAEMVKECEHLMAKDKTIDRECFCFNAIEKSYVFLDMLATKMNCNISEFFSLNQETRNQKIYVILEGILEECKKTDYIQGVVSFGRSMCEDEYGIVESEDFDEDVSVTRLSINPYFYLDIDGINASPDDIPECGMEYYIDRVKEPTTEKEHYCFVVSAWKSPLHPAFGYMHSGCVLHKETEGRMKDFFEATLELYLSRGEEFDGFVFD